MNLTHANNVKSLSVAHFMADVFSKNLQLLISTSKICLLTRHLHCQDFGKYLLRYKLCRYSIYHLLIAGKIFTVFISFYLAACLNSIIKMEQTFVY